MSLDELQRLARTIAGRGANAIEAAPGLAAAAEQFLPAEGLIHLLNGRLLIPRWALEAELRAVLRYPVRLVGLTCYPDGLHLELEVAAWGGWARLAASVVLSVESVIVSDAGQRAAVRLRPVGLRGRNLAGQFAAVLARIRWRGTGGFPPTSAWLTAGTSAEVRRDPHDPDRIEINLSSHPMISRLYTARIAGQPLLRWIKVVGCRHTPEGLLLHLQGERGGHSHFPARSAQDGGNGNGHAQNVRGRPSADPGQSGRGREVRTEPVLAATG